MYLFIIGVGQISLMLTCPLSLYSSVAFRIIDKNSCSTKQSRALVVYARLFELLAQSNLANNMIEQGTCDRAINLFLNDGTRFSIRFTDIEQS
jgi:hypothetical protein